MRATGTPAPNRPWYCPCRPAGARSKLICHAPADCRISPHTWSPAATSSTANSTHRGASSAVTAKAAQEASIRTPPLRTVRTALGRSRTTEAVRTWKSITAPVLSTRSAETAQPGAAVRSAIQSGTARLISGIRSSMTMLSRVTSAYGRSRSTVGSAPRRGTAAGLRAGSGSRASSRAHPANAAASSASAVRYAPAVPMCRATPPTAAPSARPALSADWRWASTPVRPSRSTSPASSDCRAAASPHCAVA
ncbi:hypothetical protein AMK24_04345 [Streptomyces sp. CB02366]|nr:hypothetical protein AMK24_04345 [Streptomyces sp. CB02366]